MPNIKHENISIPSSLKTETALITTGNIQSGSWRFVNPPVYRGSTVLFDSYESLISETTEYIYGRWATPTSNVFCEAMTKIEHGAATIVTGSGLAAISTSLLALAPSGSHILISESSYPGALRFCETILTSFGVNVEKFSLKDTKFIQSKIRPNTVLIYVDIPGNYGMDLFDLKTLRAQATAIPIIVDNTWATPFYCNPIKLGADVVIHSISKYIAGHSDSIMGCIVFKDEDIYLKVRNVSRVLGQYAGADDLNLALRGLKTLGVRMKQHFNSALKIATWMSAQNKVEKVFYAPLESDDNHTSWAQQFRGGGGVLSFIFQPKYEPYYVKFLDNLQLINLGWGWGGYESIISASTISTGKYTGRMAIRLSVGLEATEDIINDLECSFGQID